MILTGGDPLVLSPRRLATIMARLAAIDARQGRALPHARAGGRARAGRRRSSSRRSRPRARRSTSALHANHPRELTPAARAACARLVDAGIAMVSQTVLLRGVNDDAETLAALMRAFVEKRIKPYYLHHADLAPGTGHFRADHRGGPGADARRCAGASRASASRPTCSTSRAATARRRSDRAMSREGGDGCFTVRDYRGERARLSRPSPATRAAPAFSRPCSRASPRERRAFASSRRLFEASVGLVGRRGFGLSVACADQVDEACSASSRLRSCVRCRWAVMTSTPSDVRRLPASRSSRDRTSSGSEGERAHVEAQLHRGRDLVDVLPARARSRG